ncbi:MAG: cysteine desulfurase [Roseivirga sp.]|uniref:cysteine desulfurase n=1 Tax=Roseivirga sp. TaxID=1964215 RepID=UPI001B19DD2F|nr:cysteine desulfurase [Roseivirga sp.]MBO6660413.1 cysteine desulfurase [Roseivirga sp.]MBO6759930.1 cysteine desulfurase [Roseivirga sp.]MBO6906850.1 cysteine desulfurase [Roseivirga sp.]
MSDTSVVSNTLDIEAIRSQFPILHQKVNGKQLVYLDNAATNQKPQSVINALEHHYAADNSNIHRGIHTLAERSTTAFEDTRKAVQAFINSNEVEEIIFTKGTTESINLVASSWGRKYLNEGDEIIVSGLEHHSNIVPWQLIAEEKGARVRAIPVLDNGDLDIAEFSNMLSNKTKLVAVNHASNSLGTINPVHEIIKMSHEAGAKVLIDGAQASSHLTIDVQALDADFYALSAHKMYGPTGVGILYGKRSLLEKMPPYQGGGEMIKDVSFDKTTFNDIPYKFEAGTPNIADVVAFKAAIDFINDLGKENIAAYEEELLSYATAQLNEIEGVRIIGQAQNKVSVISFVVDGIHHFDLGMWMDAKGVAVRTGHHCTQPLMDRFSIEGTTRASFSVYNTIAEIDIFVEALKDIIKKLKP